MTKRDVQLGKIIADYLDASGESSSRDIEELKEQYPDFSEELQSFYVNHLRMQHEARVGLLATVERRAIGPLMPNENQEVDRRRGENNGYHESVAHQGEVHHRIAPIRFGDFELLDEIARGGMGIVYRARQQEPNRIVALKMIHPNRLENVSDLRRFQTESEAAAKLDHPNIVPVFDVGNCDGQHFYSMGYIDGESLASRIAMGPVTPKEAATVTMSISRAIGYAHDQGVIHRDLKPANILFAGSTPKVADFGLAKRTEDDQKVTTTGQILGTPSYMPPEQASGKIEEVKETADVYSLGAILYCQLVGRPPFQADNPMDTLLQVMDKAPVPPREIDPSIPQDLETICLKCLEKDYRARYQSAHELARDLKRFVDNQPIVARPIGHIERMKRWCRRHPARSSLVAMVVLALSTLAIGGPLLAARQTEIAQGEIELRHQADQARLQADQERDEAERQRRIANEQRQQAAKHLAEAQFTLGKSALKDNRVSEALNWYVHALVNSADDETVQTSARNVIGAIQKQSPDTLVLPDAVHRIAMSSDGRFFWTGYLSSQSQIWDMSTKEPIGVPLGHAGDVVSGEFSADGTKLLTCAWRGVKVWDTSTGELLFGPVSHEIHEGSIMAPKFSPSGEVFATRDTFHSFRLWDASTGEPIGDSHQFGADVVELQFSADGRIAAARSSSSETNPDVIVVDVETGDRIGEPWRDAATFALHPNGEMLVTTSSEGTTNLWSIHDRELVAELPHEELMTSYEFNQNGSHLFAYRRGWRSENRTVIVWKNVLRDNRTKLVVQLTGRLNDGAMSPNGRWLALADGRTLRLIETNEGTTTWSRSLPSSAPFEDVAGFGSVEFSPNSLAVLARGDGDAFVFSVDRRGWLLAKESNLRVSSFGPAGDTFVTGSEQGWARVRSVSSIENRPITRLTHGNRLGITRVAISDDSRRVVTADRSQNVQVWNAETWEAIGELIHFESSVRDVVISPDDSVCLVLLPTEGVATIDLETGELSGEIMPYTASANILRFDESGNDLFIGMRAGNARFVHSAGILDWRSGTFRSIKAGPPVDDRPVHELVPMFGSRAPRLWNEELDEPARVKIPAEDADVSFLTPNRRLIMYGFDGWVELWDLDADEALGPRFQIEGNILANSDDGRFVLAGVHDSTQIWDAITGRRCGQPLADTHTHMAMSFSHDGCLLATYEGFYTRLWDCATGEQLGPPMRNRSTGEHQLVFSSDGRWLLSVDGGVEIFELPRPAISDVNRLRLQVEFRTGLQINQNGTLQKLSQREWLERKQQLDQYEMIDSPPSP